ncbi:MAG: electron transporter RnfE [Betaproteobacteria bacterium RIFCSPLOWO2_02_67_12]|nr:MAG: electron transporter RnfE [Betaproteobacteria bacterium RIFCSPLOWO2_02_67_12]OGA27354.1 MAG: electron transporter RnfE [Betaproteobacteria bacterium RIFCSPLOWO2_02_FULL_68_150]OGA70487.1 MAG: electron transporter RnfE [Betaproteobacteria bacterium RIFCSPLOWO2_12_FULL_67_28]
MWGEMGSMGWGWGWGMLGAVHMVLWWVLIVLGIAVLVKWLVGSPRGGDRSGGRGALDILKERYARGEINKDEFEQKRRDLAA